MKNWRETRSNRTSVPQAQMFKDRRLQEAFLYNTDPPILPHFINVNIDRNDA